MPEVLLKLPLTNEDGHRIDATLFDDGMVMFNHVGGEESITLSTEQLSGIVELDDAISDTQDILAGLIEASDLDQLEFNF